MKRFSSLILTLLLMAPALSADDISLEKARRAAEIFLTQGSSLTRGVSCKLSLVNAAEVSATRGGSSPAFYIFNREGGGFVIISAIDAAKPVLGYSFENSFCAMDDMPENLADWLADYRAQINARRKSGNKASADEAALWDAILSASRTALSQGGGKDLQTADWGQGAPYNGKCPVDNSGQRSLVGCTSTAISLVMYYHKSPKSGNGTLPSYKSSKNGFSTTIPSITLGEEYKWDKMLPKYSGASYTTEQADAVSTLCYHVAVMDQADFSSSATSASTINGVPKLCTYFGYDPGFTQYSSDKFSYEGWLDLLKRSIDNDCPVIYTGYSDTGGGHCFVVDGYDGNGRALINFGWNGSSNGYYEIGSFGKYINNNKCWVNVRPYAGGTDTGYMTLSARSTGGYCGLAYQSGTPAPGGSISILFGNITWNSNTASFNGKLNFKLMGKDGTDKGFLRSDLVPSSTMEDGNSRYWSSALTLKIPSDVTIERGDYIAAYYKENSSNEWKPVLYQDAEVSVIGRIYCHIADFTSMQFNASTRELVFKTFSNASYTLKNSSGSNVTTGVSWSGGVMTITTKSLAPGKYTVTFTSGGQSTAVSFKI